MSQHAVNICWEGRYVVHAPFSQGSQVVGRQSCCQHEVCHRTFVGHVYCESVPPLLTSLIHGEYAKCCGVGRPHVFWKGNVIWHCFDLQHFFFLYCHVCRLLNVSHLNLITNPTPLPNATLTIGAAASNPNYWGSCVYPNYWGSRTQP